MAASSNGKATASDAASSSMSGSTASALSIQKAEQHANNVSPSFPSPSSSFVPPPTHDPGDYVQKTKDAVAARRRNTNTSQQQVNGNPSTDVDAPQSTLPTEASPMPERRGSKAPVGEGKLAGKGRPLSDSYGEKEAPSILSGLPAPDASSSKGPSPRAKYLSSPPPLSGNIRQPSLSMMTMANADLASSPAALSPTPHQSYFSSIPENKRNSINSLSSNRRAPSSPTPSRHSSMLPSRRGSKRVSLARSTTGNERPTPQRRLTNTVLVKIRDFAFGPDDERHSTVQKISLKRNSSTSGYSTSDNARKSSGGWSSFFSPISARLGIGSGSDAGVTPGGSKRTSRLAGHVWEGARYDPPSSSQGDHGYPEPEHPSYSSQEDEYEEPEVTSESEFELEPGPFVPGFYRASYPFDSEAPSEMSLEEGQIVRCLARGGGEGWVIAIKEPKGGGNDDDTSHALVPEGYLEFLSPFENGELDQGAITPRTSSGLSSS